MELLLFQSELGTMMLIKKYAKKESFHVGFSHFREKAQQGIKAIFGGIHDIMAVFFMKILGEAIFLTIKTPADNLPQYTMTIINHIFRG